MIRCDCAERIGIEVKTWKEYEELKCFFEKQVKNDIFVEELAAQPYYIWKNRNRKIGYYATKWYRCRSCGCLWEFEYPDFPANGFVKKYSDGIYSGTTVIEND